MKRQLEILVLLSSLLPPVSAMGLSCRAVYSSEKNTSAVLPYIDAWISSPEIQKAFSPDIMQSGEAAGLNLLKNQGSELPTLLATKSYGWIVDGPYLRPKDLGSIFNNINKFGDEVPEPSRIYAALSFYSKEGGAVKWVRIGVDPLPSSDKWVYRDPGEFVHGYSELVAQGMIPFSLKMLMHDYVGHILPIQRDPVTMRAVRRFFDWVVKNPQKGNRPQLGDILNEYMTTPNLKNTETIKKMFPGSFQSKDLVQVQAVFDSYKSYEGQQAKIKYLLEKGEELLSRYGGAVGGGDDVIHAEYNWNGTEYFWSTQTTKAFVSKYPRYSKLGDVASHSLFYVLREMHIIQNQMNKLSAPLGTATHREIWNDWLGGKEDVDQMLQDRMLRRLAVLETALVNGARLQITPAKFFDFFRSEGAEAPEVADYLRSYLDPSSIWYETLLE
ncbi:MAG: hypothetical protein AB7O96_05400 [Pseudobdellovibrionaceae bacterium]